MLNQTKFYFATHRKIIVAFGSLFQNMSIRRFSQPAGKGSILQVIPVPVSYGPSQKWVKLGAESRRGQDQTKVKIILPRISYQNVNTTYDPSRKLQTLNKYTNVTSDSSQRLLSQLNPVPWDFDFNLSIITKSLDDGYQILEQILPNFTPSFNLRLDEIPELNLIHDIPVIFKSITHEDTYEGQFVEDRVLTWTLDFKVKAYLFPVINDTNVIKKVIATFYPDQAMMDPVTSTITVAVDPLTADEDDVDSLGVPTYEIDTTIVE